MFDFARTSLHRVITTKVGDSLLPVRLPKDLARRFNTLLGEPICSREELQRRRSAEERLRSLRRGERTDMAQEAPTRAVAPVMIYFEKDRNMRMLERICETLGAREIPFTLLDVTNDETTKDFVVREAKCKEDELPIVFVASVVVGGYNELVEWDVSGKLKKAVFPKG